MVKSAIELLKNNTNIQRYVFPTGKSIVDSCRTIEQRRELCGEGGRINGTCTMGTGIYESYKREECDTKIQLNLESSVNFNGKIDIFPSRVSPDNPEEGELFCLQPNTANRCDSIIVFGESLSDCQLSNAYRCDSAIGVSYTKDRTGNYTLIALGKGGDEATGFQDSPNIFLVEEGGKRFFGGNKDDMFVLRGSKVTGVLHGGVGSNTIDLGGFALESESLLVDLFRIGDLNWENINNILGREGRKDVINCSSDIKYIDGRGGKDKNAQDIVYVGPNAYSHNDEVKIAIKPYTTIDNFYSQGKFTYIIHQGKGGASINLDRSPGKHSFLFNYTVQNIKAISFSGMTAEFTFLSSSNLNKISIFSKSAEVHYALRDGTEIRVDNKGNSYALQNTDKPIDEIIRDYPAIANRLNMTIAVQSHNESIIIGNGKHEVLYNDPKYNSHLIGNGGENIYVIAPAQKEINIYDVDEESSIDTVDLRDVVKGIRGVLSTKDNSLAVSQDEDDLLIELELTQLEAKILRDSLVKVPVVRLKNGTQWYQKLHVILNNAPMQLERTDNHWKVTPIPLTFNDNTKIAAITAKDIEGRHRLIVDKQVGEYIFSRLRDDLMIVSDPNLGEGNAFIMLLSDFYQEPKMEILSIEFKDTIILLQEKTKEINEAVVFCPRILQINEKFSVNSSDMLSHYDCLKFNSDKILLSRLNNSLLLLSDKGTVLISDYVYGKWNLPIELNNSIIKPGEFRERADNPSSFKYYQPDEEGLQIYHNQPNNKNDIGLIDFKDKSILDFEVKVVKNSLVLSHRNNTIVKVENWNNYPPARKMAFAFNDTVLYNAKCIVSNCDPKDIVEEFKKEKAKLVKDSTRRHRRHHIRHEHNHRGHRNHRLPIKEVTSGAARSSSWINVFANSIVDAVKGVSRFISSPFKPAIDMQPSKAMTTQSIDTNGTLLLLDVFIRKITGQKYVSTADQPTISLQEAECHASDIINGFEKVLKETAVKSGISVTNLNFDPIKPQSAIVGQLRNGKFSEISKILYSSAKQACPECKQTKRFLGRLETCIEGFLDKKELSSIGQKLRIEEVKQIRKQELCSSANFITDNLTTVSLANTSRSESQLPEKTDDKPRTCLNDPTVNKQLQRSL
ncbi:hypothetical protein [Wolbachia endosymbiont of Oedothorax gibbosus]|uniref:hypothetical protein n=1 Tax=Wolbachia endosymbiont of Oedothorax gibbosus TaxID=931100 RepID=UPI0020242ACC|nr:hypothetical protein [Wolbachia endosymbiont of Oedothorax gibbosus]